MSWKIAHYTDDVGRRQTQVCRETLRALASATAGAPGPGEARVQRVTG